VNTVRVYERLGLIAPADRSPNGYRGFTPDHRRQMCLARLALDGPWTGRRIRRSALQLARVATAGDWKRTMARAAAHLSLVQGERARAERAAEAVGHWAQRKRPAQAKKPLTILLAATAIGVTPDAIRNWERNGLLRSSRNATNRYRLFDSQALGRLRVIAMLRDAGYSLMAILRMLRAYDRGELVDARRALDTPRVSEDLVYATDVWLTTLGRAEEQAGRVLAFCRSSGSRSARSRST
jgi:DNA-binding transcriptional MerR regulator